MTVTTGGGGAICEGCLPQPASNKPTANTAVARTESVLMKRRNSEPRRCAAGFPYVFAVAQIFNLPYRRFVIGRASDRSRAPWFPDLWQSATLRYGRLQVCATGVG